MKRIVLLVAILALQAYANPLIERQEQKPVDYLEACIREVRIDADKVKRVPETEVVGVDPMLKDRLVCLYRKMGVMNSEGEIQKTRLKEGLNLAIKDEAKVDELVGKCAKQKGTPQETAIEMYNCVIASLH